jgi:putative ABC transport system permease protein
VRVLDLGLFAGRAVARHRTRSLLIVLATAVGVAAVLLLTGLGEGARLYVVQRFATLGAELLIVFPGRNETVGGAPPMLAETPRDLTLDDAMALGRSRFVRRVAPLAVGAAQVAFGRRNREIIVIGSTAEFQQVRHVELAQGRFLPRSEANRAAAVVVIGATVRRELFGVEPALGAWLRVGERRFRVVGVMGSTGQSLGTDLDEVVLMPVASAQQLFDSPALVRILVEARRRELLVPAKADVLRILRERHEGEEDVTVVTQESVVGTFDRILRVLTLAVAGIAGISLLVAGILIMNVILVAVSQRTAEVGLLKAIGATAADVRNAFLAEAAVLAVSGALAGLVLGAAGLWLGRRLFPDFPLSPPLWAAPAAVTIAILTALVFAVLPARRAARLDPVVALGKR